MNPPAENHRELWAKISREYPTYQPNPDEAYERRIDAEQEQAVEDMEAFDIKDENHYGQG